MPTTTSPPLTILLTSSLEDGGRKAAIAFGIALSALSEGTTTRAFLSLESVILATPEGAAGLHPQGFSDPLEVYLEHFVDLGGQLEVCASCYEEYCRHLPSGSEGEPTLREGTTVRGLSTISSRMTDERILTF